MTLAPISLFFSFSFSFSSLLVVRQHVRWFQPWLHPLSGFSVLSSRRRMIVSRPKERWIRARIIFPAVKTCQLADPHWHLNIRRSLGQRISTAPADISQAFANVLTDIPFTSFRFFSGNVSSGEIQRLEKGACIYYSLLFIGLAIIRCRFFAYLR